MVAPAPVQVPTVLERKCQASSRITGASLSDIILVPEDQYAADMSAAYSLAIIEQVFAETVKQANSWVAHGHKLQNLYASNQLDTPNLLLFSSQSTSQPYLTSDEKKQVWNNESIDSLIAAGAKPAIFPKLRNRDDESEEGARGIQPFDFQHQVLFSQEVSVRLSEIERVQPTVIINPIFFDDDE